MTLLKKIPLPMKTFQKILVERKLHLKSSCSLQVYCDCGGLELAHKDMKQMRMMKILMQVANLHFNHVLCFIISQETRLNVQEGEYALSKDLAVSLWTEFRAYYGYTSLREVFCGSFIVVNDNLQDEFKEFTKRVSSYIGASYNVVKANELIRIWLKSCDITLKSVNVLGNMYFLMDGSDLDDLCLWIYSKRTYYCDKEVTIENLLEPSEPKNSIPVTEDNVLLQYLDETDENVSDDTHIDMSIHLKFVTYQYVGNGKKIIAIYSGSRTFMETWNITLHM